LLGFVAKGAYCLAAAVVERTASLLEGEVILSLFLHQIIE
jgi:hypothetical protein